MPDIQWPDVVLDKIMRDIIAMNHCAYCGSRDSEYMKGGERYCLGCFRTRLYKDLTCEFETARDLTPEQLYEYDESYDQDAIDAAREDLSTWVP